MRHKVVIVIFLLASIMLIAGLPGLIVRSTAVEKASPERLFARGNDYYEKNEYNKAIEEYFSQAEIDMDSDTRFCVDWFLQYGFATGQFGEADVLARAKGTTVDGVAQAGVIESGVGKVRLLRKDEYPEDWDPKTDKRTPVWEACHHLCRAFTKQTMIPGEPVYQPLSSLQVLLQ